MSVTDEAALDALLDRRRLRRKVSVWRLLAFAAVAVAILTAIAVLGPLRGGATAVPHVARVSISGIITDDREMTEMLERIGKNDAVEGVIVAIDSPGGTAVGGEAIFEAVRKLSEAKPTTATVGTVAASAGYMIASATDHIVARNASIVGSIGVIFQYPQAERLLDRIGIEVREIKSAPLKAEPSPFNATPPEAEAMVQRFVDESFAWFVDLVAERRPMSRAEVVQVADGSIFSGRQGVKLKLIDALGGEREAREWLTGKGISTDLKVVDWEVPRDRPSLLGSLGGDALVDRAMERLGLSGLARRLRGAVGSLDVPMAIWHPTDGPAVP